jgi:hypothetical protein
MLNAHRRQMARYTIVLGNGLGMSLDRKYFSLSAGLAAVWSGTSSFTQQQKKLVISAIPGLSSTKYPESEEQLDILHVALVAAGFLKSFESPKVKWLSKSSRKLPQAFRQFVHEVGVYFHSSDQTLPESFVTPLVDFVNDTKSHVAVLNYDNLLYDAFVQTKVLDGYNGSLIDGFWGDGFASKNLERYNVPEHGWYLHLHGSPLYIGNKKLMRKDRRTLEPTENSHIVLTHVKHKPLIIASSNILSEYWRYFDEALDESDRVVLFGYSGCDTHLNDRLHLRCQGKTIHVVEWRGNGESTERRRYWKSKLKDCDIKLQELDNILQFTNWKRL